MNASAKGKNRKTDAARRDAEDHGLLRYCFTAFMVEHLIDCRRAFGDLEAMLVMRIVTQQFLRARFGEPDRLGDRVTASQIAEKTGIPRQTVRRKLFSLERRGWVRRADDAAWGLATCEGEAAVSADIASLDARGLDRLVTLMGALDPHFRTLKSPRSDEARRTFDEASGALDAADGSCAVSAARRDAS